MAQTISIEGPDGFAFQAYHEQSFTPRKGGVIVVQEIFGLDRHVRADVEMWAKAGYEAVAPSLFDRRERGFTADHHGAGRDAAIEHAKNTPLGQALGDIAACRDYLAPRGKVFIVGYCFGGSLAWMAAAKVEGLAAASSYYGSLVKAKADLKPLCPVIINLGHTDPGINAQETEAAVHAHNPDVPVYIYEGAGHGFNNRSPERYNAAAADLARHRTLELFEQAA